MQFFNFESFISTTIIKIVFALGVVLGVLGWLAGTGVATIQDGVAAGAGAFVVGAIGLVLAVLLWRVYCEIAIVMFRIYEELNGLRAHVEGTDDSLAGGSPSGGRQQAARQQGGRQQGGRQQGGGQQGGGQQGGGQRGGQRGGGQQTR